MAKVVFFGTGEFAVPALHALAPHVVLVVSQPDRPSGRGMKLKASPVKEAAQVLGLQVETPEKSRSPEFVALLQNLNADALVVASYGQILSQAVLDSAKRGGINLHGSILPKYRGAAPIQRCILDGESETGCTLMQMDKGMDTGDIIEIVRTKMGLDETYGELQSRLALIAADQASRWIERIVNGNYPHTTQNHDQATLAPKIDRSETQLQLGEDAKREYNRFRAFTPNPGAWMESRFGRLRILNARRSEEKGEPGEVLNLNPLTVAFKNGSLELHEVLAAGGKRTTGRDFANGQRIKLGSSILTRDGG